MSVHCSGVPTFVDWSPQTGPGSRCPKCSPITAERYNCFASRKLALLASARHFCWWPPSLLRPHTRRSSSIRTAVRATMAPMSCGDADADNGDPGGNATHTNNLPVSSPGTAFLGTAKGGRGGDGGTAISITVIPFPPFVDVTLEGGDGGWRKRGHRRHHQYGHLADHQRFR